MSTKTRLQRLERQRHRRGVPGPGEPVLTDEERARLIREVWEKAQRGDQDAPAGTLSWGERWQALLILQRVAEREGNASQQEVTR